MAWTWDAPVEPFRHMAAGTACRKRPRRQGGGHAPEMIEKPLRSPVSPSQTVDTSGAARENSRSLLEGYPSGQRGQTVNLLAYAFGGSNPPPSTNKTSSAQGSARRE